jgi:hypothetical protein
VWKKLHRPLHVPTVAPGEPCPVSGVGTVNFRKYGVAAGLGPGPAYPIGFEQPGSVLTFIAPQASPEFAGSEWGGQKVLWFVTPAYRGAVLVRGKRLDAPDVLRFERGKVPPTELRLRYLSAGVPSVKAAGQRYFPSYTRLRAEGCYAYQVDGTTFSRTIVFRAVRGS